MTTTSSKNRTEIRLKSLYLISENKVSPIELNNKTIPILIVLLAIRIVANNFLGYSKSFETINPLEVFLSPISLISVGESPKTATSAPEISAEQQSSSSKMAVLSAKAPSNIIKLVKKLRGSGSNSSNLILNYLKG